MYLKVIACEVLARQVYMAAATSPHVVDVDLVARGLHETPARLRDELQRRIDIADREKYGAIALAYGLCGQSTLGLVARSKPVVVVRAHDCITLYLGSRSRYDAEFTEHPGTYYYSEEYVERSELDDAGAFSALGAAGDPRVQQTYEEYVRQYGEDNAAYLMEVMGGWQKHYKRAAYIAMGVAPEDRCRQKAMAEAANRGWEYAELHGDAGLVQRLVHGQWDDDFLVLEPGQRLAVNYGDQIMEAAAGDV
ncbi:MAG: DUF1638 domain-containing protein [Anaerolineae bacterium]